MKKSIVVLLVLFVFCSLSIAKEKIAVFPFATVLHDYNMGSLAETEMASLLIETKRFDVIERSQISAIMSEQKLSNSGIVNENDANEIGKISGVKYLVLGTVSNVRYLVTQKRTESGVYEDVDAAIVLQLKIIEVESASVIFSKTYNMKKGSGLGSAFSSLVGSGDGTPEGTLSSLLKKTYVKEISKDMLNAFPIEGEILSIEDKKTVTIDVGSDQGVKKGMVFNVITKEEKTNSSGKTRTIVKKVGNLKVTEVLGEDTSNCKVTESSVPLEEGMAISYEKK